MNILRYASLVDDLALRRKMPGIGNLRIRKVDYSKSRPATNETVARAPRFREFDKVSKPPGIDRGNSQDIVENGQIPLPCIKYWAAVYGFPFR